jgi:hypothetical protein
MFVLFCFYHYKTTFATSLFRLLNTLYLINPSKDSLTCATKGFQSVFPNRGFGVPRDRKYTPDPGLR